MKILISSDMAPPHIGGNETYMLNLSKGLIKLGHEVHWLTSRIPNTVSEEVLDNIVIHRVPVIFQSKYLFPGRQLFAITSLLKGMKLAKDFDLVQITTLVPGITGWIIAKYLNKPSVLFCHEFFNNMWHKIGQTPLEKYIYPIVENLTCKSPYDWFACPSEYSKTTLQFYGVPSNKITVIPHGLDQEFNSNTINYKNILGLDHNLIFGYIGRLLVKRTGQSKNLITLLKATKSVVKTIPQAKLVLAGEGYNELEPYVKKLELENNIIYLGKIPHDNIPAFFKMCDVVTCPAISDGFCFLLADASLAGVPTVGTKLGSHPERIDEGKTGLLSEPTPQDMSNKIITLLQDRNLRDKLGSMGKKKYEELTWERCVKKHIEMYKNLINRGI